MLYTFPETVLRENSATYFASLNLHIFTLGNGFYQPHRSIEMVDSYVFPNLNETNLSFKIQSFSQCQKLSPRK